MQSIYFLVPISLMLFIFAIFAIYYAIKSRQFDDLDNEGQRIILDDRQFRRQQLNTSPTTTPDNDNAVEQAIATDSAAKRDTDQSPST